MLSPHGYGHSVPVWIWDLYKFLNVHSLCLSSKTLAQGTFLA